jgi:hypothetical protein
VGVFTDIETGLYQRLTTTGGTVFYGLRVYEGQAPAGDPLPYVIFNHMAGGEENMTPTRGIDADYLVECVASTRADARSGAGYIEAALHDQTLTFSGWNCVAVTQTRLFSRIDNVEGKQWFRRGAYYRIRLSK